MDRDTVGRSLIGGLGLFFIFLAISAVLGVLSDHPDGGGGLIFAASFAWIGAYLLRIRRKPTERHEEPVEQPAKQPMVRKEWLIAMAIMFVSLMAIVFTMYGGHGVTQGTP